jgi:Na+/H+ antiporter NhaA
VSDAQARSGFSGRTAWARSLQQPLRDFLATESGSASILLAAAVLAIAWANLDISSYDGVWHTQLSIRIGDSGISQDLRGWVNNGLMTFFFFVVGLEVRREFDVGELRERRRLALPVLAAGAGMAVPVAIYLAFNAGHGSAQGWGVAMSTDTAFALGMLVLVGPRFPDRLRGFLLTIIVVDDVIALLVIAIAYSSDVAIVPLLIAAGVFCLALIALAARIRQSLVYLLLATVSWWRCSNPASIRSSSASRSASSPAPTRPAAASSSGPPICSASSASSRRRSWPERPAAACAPRSRRMPGCSRSTTPGLAT